MKSLELGIESDLGNVNLVAVATNRVCRELGLDESRAGQIELCVAEATTNAIRHAYQGQPGHLVEVRLSASREELQVEVIDSGTPMPLKHQQVLLEGSKPFDVQPADLRSLAEGGRGLQIIFELMDKVSYVSGEANNRLIMTKRLPANPASS